MRKVILSKRACPRLPNEDDFFLVPALDVDYHMALFEHLMDQRGLDLFDSIISDPMRWSLDDFCPEAEDATTEALRILDEEDFDDCEKAAIKTIISSHISLLRDMSGPRKVRVLTSAIVILADAMPHLRVLVMAKHGSDIAAFKKGLFDSLREFSHLVPRSMIQVKELGVFSRDYDISYFLESTLCPVVVGCFEDMLIKKRPVFECLKRRRETFR